MTTKLLIVEDNPDLRSSLSEFFSSQGMSVNSVASTEEGIDEVDEKSYDIGLIDINLPGKSGFEMIEYIREIGQDIPLIAMTARDGIDDKLRGFDLGLTDYIVKPFDMKELNARLQAHLRNAGTNDTEEMTVGEYNINPANLSFKHKGRLVELTQLEFKIMYLLLKNKDVLVELDDLIEYAWGESENMLNPPVRIHIANLRKKIGDETFSVIKTVPGRGYIFQTESA